MGKVKINNLKTYAYHGCLNEERKIGSEYIVNLSAAFDSTTSSKTDNLNDTVDYVKITEIVKKQMQIRANMIEVPAKRIVDAILKLHKVQKVKVEVEKIQPPIDATFDKISVTVKGSN